MRYLEASCLPRCTRRYWPEDHTRVLETGLSGMGIASDVTEIIGNTPMLRLNRITRDTGVTVIAKLEMLELGGSIKTRPAVNMIEAAERREGE